MAVISVRFNEKESKILKKLSSELDIDQSTVIKKSIMDTYEDLVDRQVIADFEKSASKKKTKFHSFEQILGS
ncbi:DUF6290 family protein [Turneriella parva]|uniref:Uncharacterized protein n=1 Tax=Turneriella parva (strain ATCC BAA-1111 / DSM 21527 / NCTC 11395 / H) TaxID=869212 RepID=I4BA36_TURPD|nr:hypothetical protein Turpa_3506 [Turneriella parva DSM 21527]